MKKKLAVLFSSLVIMGTGGAILASPASATFAGSCGWSTSVDGVWHWSPSYGLYESYLGHAFINGRNFRHFVVYYPINAQYDHFYVYCG